MECICFECGYEWNAKKRPQRCARYACRTLAWEHGRKANRGKFLRHGHAVGGTTPTYNAWLGIRRRCMNPNNPRWRRYGGRGIRISNRWGLFKTFLADMGERPEGTTLDRKNNNGNYTKSNCRWATPQEQQNNLSTNRRLKFHGRTRTLGEWSRLRSINKSTLAKRISRGWAVERALTEPSSWNEKRVDWNKPKK